MLRIVAVIVLIGQAVLYILALLSSWSSAQHVFAAGSSPPNIPDRLITLTWLAAIVGIDALAAVGLAASGVSLVSSRPSWRMLAIVSALTSLVGILPWIALLPSIITCIIATIDLVIIGALALPWGDYVAQSLQRR